MLASVPLAIKRHYTELSEKETQEVVETVADLIVTFLKGRREPAAVNQEPINARDVEPRADAR